MKLPSKPRWLLLRKPDIPIERCANPARLELPEAASWIKENKPILWIGSIFSVPEPSGFPSGYAISRSLFDLIFPPSKDISEIDRERLISSLITKWPLEALLDEFEVLDFDISKSLLAFFAKHDRVARPNILHRAVIQYYEQGFARRPLCITTNWDSLLEKAFRLSGYKVNVDGPNAVPRHNFVKGDSAKKMIYIYHPHGSFKTKDVVCSYFQEQQQLSLPIQPFSEPTLFLGYSGYEPSLYRHLEHRAGQLWCVRDESDFEIPSKRRLLCRPNTFVYIGDLQELLKAIGVLPQSADMQSTHLANEAAFPEKVVDVIRSTMTSRLGPALCFGPLVETLYAVYGEPEDTLRYSATIRSIESHIRNRVPHPGIPLALMAAANFRNSESLWIDQLAYMLRFAQTRDNIIADLLKAADSNRGLHAKRGEDVLTQLVQCRTRCYKSFLRRPEREGDDVKDFMLSGYSAIALGDLGLAGELTELAAFACLRDGEPVRAKAYFDTAATYYYLTGLWNSGRLCELASDNLDLVKRSGIENLLMPDEFFRDRVE